VRGIKSTKSCLHILAERGNYELTKLLLDRIDPLLLDRLTDPTTSSPSCYWIGPIRCYWIG